MFMCFYFCTCAHLCPFLKALDFRLRRLSTEQNQKDDVGAEIGAATSEIHDSSSSSTAYSGDEAE